MRYRGQHERLDNRAQAREVRDAFDELLHYDVRILGGFSLAIDSIMMDLKGSLCEHQIESVISKWVSLDWVEGKK